jgi:L-fucose mutarotase
VGSKLSCGRQDFVFVWQDGTFKVVGKPDEVLEVHNDLKKSVDGFSDRDWPMGSIERHAFYERSKQAYAVVSTSERRPYGCFILVKGVIGPDGNVM